MKFTKFCLITFCITLLFSTAAHGGDFSWMNDFNVMAQADPSGFRARLDARFQIGDVDAVLSAVTAPSDAYMLLRLGQMSRQPMDRVIRSYQTQRGRGWGALAKSLGIKPGSPEFHALKRGQDLYAVDESPGKGQGKGQGKSPGKGKGKGKGKGWKK